MTPEICKYCRFAESRHQYESDGPNIVESTIWRCIRQWKKVVDPDTNNCQNRYFEREPGSDDDL